jgi:hypothetical protein
MGSFDDVDFKLVEAVFSFRSFGIRIPIPSWKRTSISVRSSRRSVTFGLQAQMNKAEGLGEMVPKAGLWGIWPDQ